ncbi:hypothetical protein NQ317_000699, partial [Molorchus minor]
MSQSYVDSAIPELSKSFGCCGEKDIITDSRLAAVRELIVILRENVQLTGQGWAFRGGAAVHQGVVQEILTAIRKGTTTTVRNILEAGWRLEAAQALYLFLTGLPRPLIPQSIQALVLDDSNGNISADVVATDVLGLLKQELPNKHIKLISLLLNLLDTIVKFSPADELRGNTLPIVMLPLFFNIQTQHMQEWRRIVTIFVELIRQASQQLETLDIDNVRTLLTIKFVFVLFSLFNRQIIETHIQCGPFIFKSPCLSENIVDIVNQTVEEPVELRENEVVRTYLIPV